MAGTGGSILMGRVATQSRSAIVRGQEIMDNPKLLGAFKPRARLSPSVFSSSSRLFAYRGLHSHPAIARFDPTATGAAMIANSAYFRRSAQLERHLNPRPWNARRLLSTNPTATAGSSPNPASFIVQLIEKLIQFLASLLPSKAFVEKVEEEVDAAADMIEEGAKIVSDIADRVEELAHAAELGAEDVERIAQKVADMTKKVQKIVDDVADVLEGERGYTTLVKTVEQLKNVAEAKRAQANDIAAAAITTAGVSEEKSEATTLSSEEK